jgi:hypothetical protein
MRTLAEKQTAVNTRKCNRCGARPGTQCKKVLGRSLGRQTLVRLSVSETHEGR